MDGKLREAAARCEKDGMILLLENEMSCNTATGAESKRTLAAVTNKNFMLNWDPGNAAAIGEYPYSKGFDLLPKARIGHCHAKDVVEKSGGKHEWAPVGDGVVEWPGQIRDLLKMRYHYAISLETHWRGAGTPEASTRVSMAGLKKVLANAGVQC
jgi:sugar phosphate isomerase/epimerase